MSLFKHVKIHLGNRKSSEDRAGADNGYSPAGIENPPDLQHEDGVFPVTSGVPMAEGENSAADADYEELMHLYQQLRQAYVEKTEYAGELAQNLQQLQLEIEEKDARIEELELSNKRLQEEADAKAAEISKITKDSEAKLAEAENRLKKAEAVSAEKDRKLAETDEKLREALNALKQAKLNRSPDTSSTPGSVNNPKSPKKKIHNSRTKSGKPQGAQKGHKGHARKDLQATETKYLDVPESIKDDAAWEPLPETEWKKRKVVEIRFVPSVVEYVCPIFRNKLTGEVFCPEFPDFCKNEINYGAGLKAVTFLLNNYCNVSIRKTSELISELTNGTIRLSTGFINTLPQEFSNKSVSERLEYFKNLHEGPYMHVDFTNARACGHYKQVAVMVNDKVCMHFLRDKKGFEGLKGTPLEGYLFIVISDHDITFYNYGSAHQECLAHILRALMDIMEMDHVRTWHGKMHDLLQKIIHEFKQANGDLTEERIEEIEKEYKDLVEPGRQEYREYLDEKKKCPEYYKQSFNLWKRFDQSLQQNNHLLFLRVKFEGLKDDSVPLSGTLPYTNNPAELEGRGIKRSLHAKVTFRSDEGGIYLCNARDVLCTCVMQGKSVFEKTLEVFNRPGHNETRKTRAEKDREKAEQAERERLEEEQRLQHEKEEKEAKKKAKATA